MADQTFDTITKDQVKAYFGYTQTDKDSRITVIMPMAAAFIKEYCRHDFESKLRENEYPEIDPCSEYFFLKYRPVSTIVSLTENGIALTENTDFYVRKGSGRVERIGGLHSTTGHDCLWDSSPNAICVNYIGGEVLTQDVIQVFFEIVGIFSGLRTRGYVTNEGVEAVINMSSVPPDLLSILDLHKHVRI
ncbi:MAG: hypothetical protein ABIL22_07950 [candidate division WOR-3 bacterium]